MKLEVKKKYSGIILCSIGAILGIIGTWILFIQWFEPLQAAMLPLPSQGGVGTDAIIILFLPIVGDLAIIGGVLYAISSLAFYSDKAWAFSVAVIANILSLQASFWPFIPAITVSQPPVYFMIFIPNLLIYFGLLIFIGDIGWSRTILALMTGIAFVMSFMNGVASTKHIFDVIEGRMDTGGPIYVISQRINWIGAFGFAATSVGILLYPEKEWFRFLGIGSAILALVGGLPLAIINTIEKGGEISMFFFAPILCIPLLLVFLWPRFWFKIVGISEV
jgi:hypothetical protein